VFYADPDNPEAWGDAIDLLERDPVARADLIDKGRRRASVFRWGASARQLMTIIEDT
jgi:glycosyltransferase involved in cell wall biosynthesis